MWYTTLISNLISTSGQPTLDLDEEDDIECDDLPEGRLPHYREGMPLQFGDDINLSSSPEVEHEAHNHSSSPSARFVFVSSWMLCSGSLNAEHIDASINIII